ncbi:MAG: ribonuclease Z, partial [Candidatus Nanoarchaeia archaeon]
IAEERKHLTSKQAAEIAKKAKVKKLAITHVSQRYDKDFSQILKQAKEIFKKSYLVEDLEIIEV